MDGNKLIVQRNGMSIPIVGTDDCPAYSFSELPLGTFFLPYQGPTIALSKDFRGLSSDSIYPPTIRIGDFDIDGYPDILFTAQYKNGSSASFLCLNQEGQFDNLSTCSQIGESSVAGFFDFDEDGYMIILNIVNRNIDILLVGKDNGKQKMIGYYQYYNRDSFFLKVKQLQNENDGDLYYGAEFTYIYTDLEGVRHVGVGFQVPQNSYTPLQVPYGLIGIGRSSNYIEHLNIVYSVSMSPNSRVWSPIIPNSQIIIKSFSSNSKE